YGNTHDKDDLDRTMGYRQQLRETGISDYEALVRYAGWQDQAVKLVSLDRQYVKDLCRDYVWRFDRSPAREIERQQSMERTFKLAMRGHAPTREPVRTPTRQPQRAQAPLRALAGDLERLDDAPQAGAALRVRLYEREREQDRGIGW